MSALSEISPKERQLVMALVSAAGVDVSDWGNYQRGPSKASTNPKYCYEWSFIEPHKLVVLSLWHSLMQEQDGSILQVLNMRELALQFKQLGRSVWARRSLSMDHAIQTAAREGLPIRVVVCEGKRSNIEEPESRPSKVAKRLLDLVPWSITHYDWSSGQCTLTRGTMPDRFADQFSIQPELAPERRDRTVPTFMRSAEVRRQVRERSQGKCEWCGEVGFEMSDGRVYIETHHVVALAEGGLDNERNVVALCPKHHREAHYGVNSTFMHRTLLSQLANDAEHGASSGRLTAHA
jgi:5-methylcytosine-specific restriction protein A